MNPPILVDVGNADPSTPTEPDRPIHPEIAAFLALDDAAMEEGIARFAAQFEALPESERSMIDEVGTSSRRRTKP